MDTRLRTSFVPKKTLVTKGGSGSRALMNPLVSIGIIVFFMALAIAAGVFLYKALLQKQVDGQQADLVAAKEALVDTKWISTVKRLDLRLKTARTLLDSHTVVVPVFETLQRSTLKTVRFTAFDFSSDASHNVSVRMKGEAASYSSVALLSDSFNQEKNWRNPLFSDLTLTPTGTVTFSFSGSIDPSLILYKTSLTAQESGN